MNPPPMNPLGLSSSKFALQTRAREFSLRVVRPRASKMLGWKPPQTRDGYQPKSSLRDAAE